MDGNKSEESSLPSLDPTDDGSNEISHPATPPWRQVESINVAGGTLAGIPARTERLFERQRELQQMMGRMATMVQDIDEEINSLRAPSNTGNPQEMSALTSGRTGSSSLNPASGLETLHQGEYRDPALGYANPTTPTTSQTSQTGNPDALSGSSTPSKELHVAPKTESWIKELLTTLKLSQKPMPQFNGDKGTCADYWAFKRAFQYHVGAEEVPCRRKLEYLVSAYSGPAKQELCGCQELEDPKEAYKEAWGILETRHGNKRHYVRQLIRKVLGGPSVRLNDIKGLRLFMDDLSTCIRNLKVMGELRQIDTDESICIITERFKGKLRDDYTDESHRYEKKGTGNTCGIEWLLLFTKDMLEKAENTRQRTEESSGQRTASSLTSSPAKRTTGLTTAVSEFRDVKDDSCPLCQERHILDTCRHFIGMSIGDRFTLARRERLCMSCLRHGHWMTACNRKIGCGIDGCLEFHSRLLHITGNTSSKQGSDMIQAKAGRYTVAPRAVALQGAKRGLTDVVSIKEAPFTPAPKKLRQSPLKAIMPPRPSTSGTTPGANARLPTGGEATTLVTSFDSREGPFRWIRTLQTDDEGNDSSTETSDHKA